MLMFDVEDHPVGPTTRFKEDLHADNLDRVELQGALWSEFSLPAEIVIAESDTVGQVIDRIKRAKKCPGAPQ